MPPHGTARCLTVLLYCARWRALRNPSPVCVHSVQLSVAYTEHSSSQSGQQCSIALDTALLHQGTLASPRHYQGCRLLVRRGSVIACLATTRSSPLSGLSTPRLAWLGSVSARLATSALASSPRSRRLASIRARLASPRAHCQRQCSSSPHQGSRLLAQACWQGHPLRRSRDVGCSCSCVTRWTRSRP
jgi:hypothetical protein